MLPLMLIALAADPEPAGDAPKVIARAPWNHAKPAGDVTGKDQVQKVIRGAAELPADTTEADLASAMKVKKFDWDKQMLVVVTGGTKSSGGHKVEVTGLSVKDKALVVSWKATPPSGVALTVLTHPGEVVLVPRYAKVTFDPAKAK